MGWRIRFESVIHNAKNSLPGIGNKALYLHDIDQPRYRTIGETL